MKKDAVQGVDEQLTELLSSAGVGMWDWNLVTGKVVYSATWAQILGYAPEELPPVAETWAKMVLAEDLVFAQEQIELHIAGEVKLYEASFRMVCKNGDVIWAQDKGQIVEFDEDGMAVRFIGVLQNVTELKKAELKWMEYQETLDLAICVSELGTLDWDIPGNFIYYNDEYLKGLGYSREELNGSFEEWKDMVHPDDVLSAAQLMDAYIEGTVEVYECELRMRHRDGRYIWGRNKGRIVARGEDGRPTRIIGGYLNIDALKCSKEQLTKALETLEYNNTYLETQVEERNKELLEQDQMLLTVNQISRKLLVFQPGEDFGELVKECLRLLGESINKNRVYIWKDRTDAEGKVYCTQVYEWVRGAVPIQDDEDYAEIPYEMLPNFLEAITNDQCLNSLLRDLSDNENEVLGPQGIKTILIAPMVINGKQWGFIGVDDCEKEELFTEIETNTLFMSGTMLCNTIEKMETEATLREVEERTQIMLDATPLCCNLWTEKGENINCNEEAVRLFDLSSQEEYLERFHELSPAYQPNGECSEDMAAECIKKAFVEGYCRFEWLHHKLDGTPIPAEITLVRIKYKKGFMVAGYTRDLREEKAMLSQLQSKEDDLRTARDEALLSSKAKSNFLANMSHEIRTPMNAISGLAEIILRESTNEKAMEYAKGIKDACGNLMNIINDILDISKIESGKLEIFNSPYEMTSLLNDVITISRVRLGNKPLMFTANIDSNLPARLVGDEIRIKQILINILSNAIKFTQEGYIELRISSVLEGDRATLHISVKDSGVGIKQEDLDRLFAEFERVNTTKNRSIEGTGLGLAISKQLCEMMNGRIEVDSNFGQGTEFRVIIPQKCQEYEKMVQVEETKSILLYEPRDRYRASIAETLDDLGCKCVPCSNQSEIYDNINCASYDYILTAALHLKKIKSIVAKNNMTVEVVAFADYGERTRDDKVYTIQFPVTCLQLSHLLNGYIENGKYLQRNDVGSDFLAPSALVLVVDDNPVNLQVAKGLMEPYQFTIETAQDGLEAVEKVKSKAYDLVFMDHMMPVMDGIDATIAIRNLKGKVYQELPIVALTANALVGTREMFIREGMNDFLAKPIELNKLANVLVKWLPQSKVIRSSSQEFAKKEEQIEGWAIKGVNTVQGILSVGGSKENYLNILCSYHADGKHKCLSLLQHIAEGNISAFRTQVHALKSTSATIGALEVSKLAANLEEAAQNKDVEFVDSNIDEFLTQFQAVLEAIWPILPKEETIVEQGVSRNSKEMGNIDYLNEMLIELQDAADFANITQMEDGLKKLREFAWTEEITKEFANMQTYLSVFDYDGVLECVLRLKG